MNINDVLLNVKDGDVFWVFDGSFGDGYKITNIDEQFIITLDNKNHPKECVPAKSSYDLKELMNNYKYKIDDCSRRIEGIQFGVEFYKDNFRKFAIEIS